MPVRRGSLPQQVGCSGAHPHPDKVVLRPLTPIEQHGRKVIPISLFSRAHLRRTRVFLITSRLVFRNSHRVVVVSSSEEWWEVVRSCDGPPLPPVDGTIWHQLPLSDFDHRELPGEARKIPDSSPVHSSPEPHSSNLRETLRTLLHFGALIKQTIFSRMGE